MGAIPISPIGSPEAELRDPTRMFKSHILEPRLRSGLAQSDAHRGGDKAPPRLSLTSLWSEGREGQGPSDLLMEVQPCRSYPELCRWLLPGVLGSISPS